MGFHTGKDGVVKIAGGSKLGHVQTWNLDVQAEVAKGWGMGDGWQTSLPTVKSWSGSVEVYFDSEDMGQSGLVVGETVALEFYPRDDATTGAAYFSGSAVVTGKPITAPKGDFVSVNFSFDGSGPLATSAVS